MHCKCKPFSSKFKPFTLSYYRYYLKMSTLCRINLNLVSAGDRKDLFSPHEFYDQELYRNMFFRCHFAHQTMKKKK